MTVTPNLSLPYILSGQAMKHVTHNEALRMLDALLSLSVQTRSTGTPPADPGEGAHYIVAAPAGGDWSAQEGCLASWQDGAWSFHVPAPG